MNITMLETKVGSRDGVFAQTFVKDETYDLSATPKERDLADVFLREGWAKEAKATKADEKPSEDAPSDAHGKAKRKT